jgi:hypothetical protein
MSNNDENNTTPSQESQSQESQETQHRVTPPRENLRLDVGGRNIVSSTGWKSYFIGATVALVVGVGLFTLGKNAPETMNVISRTIRRE